MEYAKNVILFLFDTNARGINVTLTLLYVLCLFSLVCVRSGRKLERQVFTWHNSLDNLPIMLGPSNGCFSTDTKYI